MNGFRFIPPQLVWRRLALLAAAAVLLPAAVLGANAPPSAVLQPANQSAPPGVSVAAPNSSDALEQMQASAPEVAVIKIITVKTQAGKPADDSVGSGAMLVTARAVVTKVIRSVSGLKIGDPIYLLYGYAPSAPGKAGPQPIPVIKDNAEYVAYLNGGPGDKPYNPAAGAKSFIDTAALPAPMTGGAKSTEPVADPDLLPTPDNPSPKGLAKMTKGTLNDFVTLSQTDNHWTAKFASHPDVVPLQTLGDAKPVLVAYYLPPLRAPATQPSLLVYQAGTQSIAKPAITGLLSGNQPTAKPVVLNFTVERAAIIDNQGHLLGDALWALRAADDEPVPLPQWHWQSYKLEVEDPVTAQVQTIYLSGASAPTP